MVEAQYGWMTIQPCVGLSVADPRAIGIREFLTHKPLVEIVYVPQIPNLQRVIEM